MPRRAFAIIILSVCWRLRLRYLLSSSSTLRVPTTDSTTVCRRVTVYHATASLQLGPSTFLEFIAPGVFVDKASASRHALPPAYSPSVECDETTVIPAFFSSSNARCSNGIAWPVAGPVLAIPQRTADTISPFVRAYPPSLGFLYSIPRCKWLEFIDAARDYMVSKQSPCLSSWERVPDAC